MTDIDFMQKAIDLSIFSVENNGGPFGAVVVKEEVIIAQGYNQVTQINDPTAHAEIMAIRNACTQLHSFSLQGCTIYTSCEPCPMCLGAIYWAGLDKIIYANTKHDAAEIHFDDSFIYTEMQCEIHQRKIPMLRMEKTNALKAFSLWKIKENKIAY